MSFHSFRAALELSKDDPPFYALIMAAMLKADTTNLAKLKHAWPEIWIELDARYHSRLAVEINGELLSGALPEDR